MGVSSSWGVLTGGRVLGKILGFGKLADVVEIGTDAAEGGVGPDLLGAGLGKVGEGQGMVIRPGSLEAQTAQQGMVQVGHLQPRDVGGDAEEFFQKRQGPADQHPGEQTDAQGDSAPQEKSPPILQRGDLPA